MIIVSAAKAACVLQTGIDVIIILLNSHILTLDELILHLELHGRYSVSC